LTFGDIRLTPQQGILTDYETRRLHSKPPGVSAESTHRTCEHRPWVLGSRDFRDCDEVCVPQR